MRDAKQVEAARELFEKLWPMENAESALDWIERRAWWLKGYLYRDANPPAKTAHGFDEADFEREVPAIIDQEIDGGYRPGLMPYLNIARRWQHERTSQENARLREALEKAKEQLELFNFAKDEIRVRRADDILFKALAQSPKREEKT